MFGSQDLGALFFYKNVMFLQNYHSPLKTIVLKVFLYVGQQKSGLKNILGYFFLNYTKSSKKTTNKLRSTTKNQCLNVTEH